MSEPNTPTVRIWRVRILTTTWLSYAGFYFCRKNFAIAKSSIMSSMEIDRSDVAHLFTAYLAAYMLGQFMTGFLGRRIATRLLLLAGMGMTLLCNLAFGFSYLAGPAGYWPFLILMIINGFAQSTGWLATWGSWVIGSSGKTVGGSWHCGQPVTNSGAF